MDGQRPETIAHHDHFVLRRAKMYTAVFWQFSYHPLYVLSEYLFSISIMLDTVIFADHECGVKKKYFV